MPIYYQLALLAVLILEFLVALLIWLWWRSLKEQETDFRQGATSSYNALNHIIEQTAHEAQNNLKRMSQNTETLIKAQTVWQEQHLNSLLDQYQHVFQAESQKSLETFHEKVQQQLGTISEVIAGEMKQTSTMIQQDLRQQLKDVDKEIEEYKAEQIKNISAKSEQILRQVVKEMIGRDFTPDDHHELIKHQLNQALGQTQNEYK